MTDYYEILGVNREATPEEIRAAYRSKAQVVHPDKGGGVDEFQALNTAFKILSDPEKRARYDRGEDVAGQPERTIEAVARERLAMLFTQFIDSARDNQDMVAIMKESIAHGRSKMEADIDKSKVAMQKYHKLLDRMHYNGGEDGDVFTGVVNGLIETEQRKIEALTKETKIVGLALGMLDDYEIDVDENQPRFTNLGYTSTASTGWHP